MIDTQYKADTLFTGHVNNEAVNNLKEDYSEYNRDIMRRSNVPLHI